MYIFLLRQNFKIACRRCVPARYSAGKKLLFLYLFSGGFYFLFLLRFFCQAYLSLKSFIGLDLCSSNNIRRQPFYYLAFCASPFLDTVHTPSALPDGVCQKSLYTHFMRPKQTYQQISERSKIIDRLKGKQRVNTFPKIKSRTKKYLQADQLSSQKYVFRMTSNPLLNIRNFFIFLIRCFHNRSIQF